MLGASLGLVVLLVTGAEEAPVEVETQQVRPERVHAELGARVELRSGQPDSGSGTQLTDVEIDPALAIRLPFRLGSLTLAYEPRLFLVVREYPPQEARKFSYLHRGRLVLDGTPAPRWRLYLEG